MVDASAELAEVQQELQAVKKALRTNDGYLGMRGETLQQYFLQLNEKENLVLSRQVQQLSLAAGAPGGFGVNSGPAAPPPAGPPKQFNKEDLAAVLQHMCEYEALPGESVKAVRALSSLAYANAAGVGANDQVLRQLLRLLSLHPEDENVQIVVMRALCNMAYDSAVAVQKLASHEALSALLAAASRVPDPSSKAKPGEACVKAGEALARIVAAEVDDQGRPLTTPTSQCSNLAKVFESALLGDASWHTAVLRLVSLLVQNEVIELRFIAERFVSHTTVASAEAAQGWLAFAKTCANADTCTELAPALVEAGALRAAVQLLQRFSAEAAVALTGVEAMSALVGSRTTGLQAFVDAGGVQSAVMACCRFGHKPKTEDLSLFYMRCRIEDGMGRHIDHELLQTKSIRALASGVLWPDDVQRKAGYSAKCSVALTKEAMVRHWSGEELQIAGLEALSRYIERANLRADVAEGGGEGLVKAVMTRHQGVTKLQRFGRLVLDGLGVDKAWKPLAAGLTNGTNGVGK
mmetsp:Transcript_107644/g.343565  ORF Transcript_107644/g.343565 Transcript_107644/m.343565 type:complete len:521 (-) Transcript_107644:181-1743(-)